MDSLAVAPHDSHTLEVTLGLANLCGSRPSHLSPHFCFFLCYLPGAPAPQTLGEALAQKTTLAET